MENDFLRFSPKRVLYSVVMASTLWVGSPQLVFSEVRDVQAILQSGFVKGQVVDEKGEPIIGASISVKGTTNGVITDMDGNFTLNVAPGATLVISYIGYKNQEMKVIPGKSLNIILQEDTETLEEVVVVGYGVQKKENLTGSVAAVNFKDVASMPVANTANMLQGRLPGVMLTNNGAQAGHDSPEIRIRGVELLNTMIRWS